MHMQRRVQLLTLVGAVFSVFLPQCVLGNIIYVTTPEDKISGKDGCSLKEAIFSSTFMSNIAIASFDFDRFS